MSFIWRKYSTSWFQMPTLMEAPIKKDVVYGAIISVCASIFVAILFVGAQNYANFFFGVLLFSMIGHAALSYYWFRGNILIFFRYFLLFLPIFITVLAWWIWEGEVLTAPFGTEYQTTESTLLLVTCGFLSLMGCTSGWLVAFRGYSSNRGDLRASIIKEKTLLFKVGAFLTLAFGLLYVIQVGGTLSAGQAYATGSGQGLGVEFGVFNIFQQIGVSLLILLAAIFVEKRLRLYLIIGISLFIGIMAGSRADYLPPLMIISFYFWSLRKQLRHNNTQIKRASVDIKKFILLALLGVFGFITASGVAIWRSSPELSIIDTVNILIIKGPELILNDSNYGHRMIYIETGNMSIGGMYGLIENTRRDGFLWGATYVDYIFRTPPAFLGVKRPEDLAYRTGVGDTLMSQGGTFEPAEAFVNFGLLGCFVVSFILSYFMAFLLKAANKNGSIFYASWYLVFGLLGFRDIWYQTFGYFRLATIYLLLYVFLLLFRPTLIKGK